MTRTAGSGGDEADFSHDAARELALGTAVYIDDRPFLPGELLVGIVGSPVAHGRIRQLDLQAALRVPGVVAAITYRDLHHNSWGTIIQDQPFLAEAETHYWGEAIALLAAESPAALARGLRAVKLDMEELPAILSIDEAKAQSQFLGVKRMIATGDVDTALKQAPHTLQGELRIAGQDHFYLESQAAIAYPQEDGSIEIHASSQHPTEVQHLVAEALGLPYHRVVCVVKRMGGAFGGKESQAAPFAVYAALVATKTRRPARLVLSKDDDMRITGKRNPFQNTYQVGFDAAGRILALDVSMHSDGGAYTDLSPAIMERAMLHLDNAYYLPNARVVGQVCRTNLQPTTAFRGFGGPKGMLTVEHIIEDIAQTLGLDSADVRQRNLYQLHERNRTHYGQVVDENPIPELWAHLRSSANYDQRRRDIAEFNAKPSGIIRGLAMTPVKFGISFTTRFLNQGNALVNMHLDGTVQVSTGATEMGQGVNTKIGRIVAEVFGIKPAAVRLMPTSTEKNANTSPTAASSGSDINGAAAQQAAQKIRQRLAELALQVWARSPDLRGRKVAGAGVAPEIQVTGSVDTSDVEFIEGVVRHRKIQKWQITLCELLDEAYLNRISLSEYGYFTYPGIHFNKETGQGRPFFYFTTGAAVSEVSVDRYTGEVKLLRTDILMDVGRSILRGIDLGQVTGAFVQGMGWMTTESLFYNDKGMLVSHSPSTYKIPSVQDIPRDFRVQLWPNDRNQKNVRGSKAVGEPPLMLAISVWAACKNALSYALPSGQLSDLPVPATAEALLMRMP
jgi:xanthine dehydrogenase large subunit